MCVRERDVLSELLILLFDYIEHVQSESFDSLRGFYVLYPA